MPKKIDGKYVQSKVIRKMAFLCDSDGARKNLHPISMR
jgi:hypothetical protein